MMNIDEYKLCVLNVLIKIDQICRENGIDYYVVGGTLLGAVRHQGFIPWDDDIDIMLTYANFDRLGEIIRQGTYGLNFIDIGHNEDTIFLYGKICDSSTTIVQEGNLRIPKGYGAFVDVFPIVFFPNDINRRRRETKKQVWIRRIIENSARFSYSKGSSFLTTLKRAIAFHSCKLVNTKKAIQKADRQFRKQKATNWAGPVTLPLPASFLGQEPVDLMFEGHPVKAPKNWDEILRHLYGNYMELPPEEERVPMHYLVCKRGL